MVRKKNRIVPVDLGDVFEDTMLSLLNSYMHEHNINGIAYTLGPYNGNQIIDIILDSKSLGNCAIECKSIDIENLVNDKIDLARINKMLATGTRQSIKHRNFMKTSGRYGIIAIQIRPINVVYLLPHATFCDYYEMGITHLPMDQLIADGYRWQSTGNLKDFIRYRCKV